MTRTQCLEILELPPDASDSDYVKAYRQLAQVWHPDRFPNNPDLQRKASAKLAQINEAYSALVEGRATAEASDESSQKTDKDPNPVQPEYQDHQVRYLGHDPRLKSPSTLGGLVGCEGVASFVELNNQGLTLVTLGGDGPDEAMWYAESQLQAVEEGQNRWVRRGERLKWATNRPNTPADQLHLHFRDPEGILSHSIVVVLKFRNAYFTQLLFKRLWTFTAFDKWQPPPPPPPPPTAPPPPMPPIGVAVVIILSVGLCCSAVAVVATAIRSSFVSSNNSDVPPSPGPNITAVATKVSLDGTWTTADKTIVSLKTEGNQIRLTVLDGKSWRERGGGLLDQKESQLTGVLNGRYVFDTPSRIRQAYFIGRIASDSKIIGTECLIEGGNPNTASATDMTLTRVSQ